MPRTVSASGSSALADWPTTNLSVDLAHDDAQSNANVVLRWTGNYGAWTLKRIKEVFHMEDMTLGGIKGMVEFLSDKSGNED